MVERRLSLNSAKTRCTTEARREGGSWPKSRISILCIRCIGREGSEAADDEEEEDEAEDDEAFDEVTSWGDLQRRKRRSRKAESQSAKYCSWEGERKERKGSHWTTPRRRREGAGGLWWE